MTEPRGEHGHAHGEVRAEDDRISSGVIVAVGVASLVVFFLAGLAATSYLRVKQGERGPMPIPPEVGQSKIGMVEQQLFDRSVRGERHREAQLERLGGTIERDPGRSGQPIVRVDLHGTAVRDQDLATIGRAAAVADFGKFRVTGFIAWILWLFVHILFLIGFRNRVLVMLEWSWSYLTYERSARLITGDTHLPGFKPRALAVEDRERVA